MAKRAPTLIAIDHDDYHATHVGRTADGRQFFLTTPFVAESSDSAGREFIALYLFDKQGALIEARIDDLGPRATLDSAAADRQFEKRFSELGTVQFGRIEIQPFTVTRFATPFGLVARSPETPEDDWWVTVEPGNFMAFHEPWDSGEYDT
jgi:hypothetical protein